MVEVRIRHVDYADGAILGRVDLMHVDDVIPKLREWGVADHATDDLCGQFGYDADRRQAYFEVIVGAD